MAKKGKEPAPNTNSVPNKDIIQRLNFLYQASSYLSTLDNVNDTQDFDWPSKPIQAPVDGAATSTAPTKEHVKVRKRKPKRKGTARDLSRSYVKSMKIIGQKTNTRL